MDRSRSKRNYYYDHHDYDNHSNPIGGGRTKPRYNHHYTPNNHRHRGTTAVNNNRQSKPQQDSSSMVTTTYRILCHDMKAGGVIGKSGSIIKSIRHHTGAWINVHELVSGDEERIIEISDTRRRDPDGRMPAFSPAQEALFLIHDRVLECDSQFNGGGYGNEVEDYGGRGSRVATRLVVSRMHVGCLLGKGGKIIEQMRNETKTQIRVLPRDANLPRCISMSDEIVQVVGDVNGVRNAIAIISSRLRESQHRDRTGHGNKQGRTRSPDRFFPDEDYIPNISNTGHRSSADRPSFGSRTSSNNYRNNNWQSSYTYGEDLVFKMLCPAEKVNRVVGEVDGIVDLLQNEIGVDVRVSDSVSGSNEQIIIISSVEGPDDELFPAQEALLHIQTRIADLVADKDNIVTTKLVVSSSDIGYLEGRDGLLSQMSRLTGAAIQILPRESIPSCISGADELVQIEGEIRAARNALVEVTSRLRSCLYQEFFQKDAPVPISASLQCDTPARDNYSGGGSPIASQAKDTGGSVTEKVKANDSEWGDDAAAPVNRIPVPLVTRSIIEIVIPEPAVPKLVTKSKNKLAQISELSGANVTPVEDRQDTTEKTIQISGTPEQVERAQSLLQGFILSTQEDCP